MSDTKNLLIGGALTFGAVAIGSVATNYAVQHDPYFVQRNKELKLYDNRDQSLDGLKFDAWLTQARKSGQVPATYPHSPILITAGGLAAIGAGYLIWNKHYLAVFACATVIGSLYLIADATKR